MGGFGSVWKLFIVVHIPEPQMKKNLKALYWLAQFFQNSFIPNPVPADLFSRISFNSKKGYVEVDHFI